MYKWHKLGLVITPQKNLWWMKTHAMIPTLEKLDDNLIRVYFSGRDSNNISHIGYCIIDLNIPDKVIEYSPEPVLSSGDIGCFDDNGVTPSCIIQDGTSTNLYYIGWNPGFNVRMHLFGGLAIKANNSSMFERYSKAPIIERCRVNPYLNTAPFVLKDKEKWLMYYVSGTEWKHKNLPRYNIQIAESIDGKNWRREGKIAINYKNEQEMALARPYVIRDTSIYKMWFSYKDDVENGGAYRLGYAESKDGFDWLRMDKYSGISVSDRGWDSEMIEYAAVTEHKGKKIMFYNGNNYGADGIGVAIES
jgi:predicted GH43/DUF377 family glycosyl hydrolase